MTAKRRKPMTDVDRAYYSGVATALGILARAGFNQPSTAADIAHGMGVSLADFKQARCESFDIAPLRKELRRLEQRKEH